MLSPTMVVFFLTVPVLFRWAQGGLGSRERRWVVGVLVVALVARLLPLMVFFLRSLGAGENLGVLIGDERYIKRRSLWLLSMALDRPLSPHDYANVFFNYGQSGLQDFLAYWQYWFGPSPYGLHLINVALWLTAGIVMHRLSRRAYGRLPALLGLGMVLFVPTLFVWSISGLKEPAYCFLSVSMIWGAWRIAHADGWAKRVVAGTVCVGAAILLDSLRPSGLIVFALGTTVAIGGWLFTRRAWGSVLAIIVVIAAGLLLLSRPAVREWALGRIQHSATLHIGHVRTEGYSYRLLDEEFYLEGTKYPTTAIRPAQAVRFLLRAAASVVVVPLPWEVVSRPALALLPQQVWWYLLALMLPLGVVAGFQRDRWLTWLLLGYLITQAALVAVTNGNVGTLVRMRDMFVPQVIWLGALGICVCLEWVSRHLSRGTLHGNR